MEGMASEPSELVGDEVEWEAEEMEEELEDRRGAGEASELSAATMSWPDEGGLAVGDSCDSFFSSSNSFSL